VAQYADCTTYLGDPSSIGQAGGTSESAPFVSGAAALVFQAFRSTHHGKNPTPAQVKRILLSTATDLGTPAQDQGAGLLNTYRAVQLAQSYGASKRTGATIASSAGQLTSQTRPGVTKTWKVTLTNEGQAAQTVKVSGRALNPASTFSASGSVTLNNTASNQYTDPNGDKDNYATFKFRVPAGQGRLNVAIAYAAEPVTMSEAPTMTLFDPLGRIAATSLPQGVSNFGNADVRAPAGGLWTAVVSSPTSGGNGGFAGRVTWQASTQKFASFGSLTPSSLRLGPGKSGSFVLSVKSPSSAGDVAGSVLLHASTGGLTTIPVLVRSLVNPAGGGAFTGTLTGGNGRGGAGALAASDFYQFDVPAGTPALTARFALPNNPDQGNQVSAYLVAPDGEAQGYGQNSDIASGQLGKTNPNLTASVVAPAAGRWTLVLAFAAPTAGVATSTPFTGAVTFAAAATLVPQTPLPQGTELTAGTPLTIPVTITNTSNATQNYYLDPRLTTASTVKLTPWVFGNAAPFMAGSSKTLLPMSADATTAKYFVPSDAASIAVRQTSSVPAMTDLETVNYGDPTAGPSGLFKRSPCGKAVTESFAPAGGALASGIWGPGPTECGPFKKPAPSGVATDALSVTMASFDNGVAVQTGDFERLATSPVAGSSAYGKSVGLKPGKSATVNVTFNVPAGTPAGTRHGLLYLDTLQGELQPSGQVSGDQVTALPYSYVVVPGGSGATGSGAAG
jgi:Subtilase family